MVLGCAVRGEEREGSGNWYKKRRIPTLAITDKPAHIAVFLNTSKDKGKLLNSSYFMSDLYKQVKNLPYGPSLNPRCHRCDRQ
jgi:hypothetical protein